MLRMMEALDEFGQDVQDMVEEMKGAVDVMIDSLELLAPGHH
jgi:phage-related minor tail protein